MAFRIVVDGPQRDHAARLGSGASRTIGMVLMTVGGLAVIPAFPLGLVLLFEWMAHLAGSTEVTNAISDELRNVWFGSLAAAAVGLGLGIRLVKGNRRLVLFLRRFGHTEATHAITMATARIGGFWRLVTLDDAEVVPMGASGAGFVSFVGRAKEISGKVAPAVHKAYEVTMQAAGIGAVGGLVVTAFPGNSWEDRMAQVIPLFDFTSTPDELPGLIFQMCAYVLLLGVMAAAALFAVAIPGAFVYGPLSQLYSSVDDAVRAAEGAKAIKVNDAATIATAREKAREQSARILGARLIVLKVATPVWQQTVTSLATASAVPLIDVSEPTENIVWEIQELLRRFGKRCVFVGQYNRLGRLCDPAPLGSVNSRVQTLLAGRDVLAYFEDDKSGRRFSRALRATLEHNVRLPPD